MIRKIATQLAAWEGLELSSLPDSDEKVKELFAKAAVILRGIREPSAKMKEAFNVSLSEWLLEEIEDDYYLYKAMIDAALDEVIE